MKEGDSLVQVPEFPQVDFHLIVQKEGLLTLSIVEVATLLKDISTMTQFLTMKNGLPLRVEVRFSGAMI